jgi:hypothetical protein
MVRREKDTSPVGEEGRTDAPFCFFLTALTRPPDIVPHPCLPICGANTIDFSTLFQITQRAFLDVHPSARLLGTMPSLRGSIRTPKLSKT